MRPSAEQVAKTLGALCSCFSIPAFDKKHEIHLVVDVGTAERRYLEALDILREFYAYPVEDLYAVG